MFTVLVTGGTGYIGSHTVVQLIERGFNVIIVDNLSNSDYRVVKLIQRITGKQPKFYKIDLCNYYDVKKVFEENKIDAILHFAAFKSVPESWEKPLKYFRNNLDSLINLLDLSVKYRVESFIFSSSCAVYGMPNYLPVDERHPFNEPLSPYARTKQIGEYILQDTARAYPNLNVISLRYFNPVGAHPSGLLGDMPRNNANLMTIIIEVALGIRDFLYIYGNDYDTPDGTGIRDYIHIMDVADAHIAALERLVYHKYEDNYEYYNIGIGHGISVLEMVTAFEKYTGVKIPYKFVERRPGDVDMIYASTSLAERKLKWKAKYQLKDMILTAWNWARNLNKVFYEVSSN